MEKNIIETLPKNIRYNCKPYFITMHTTFRNHLCIQYQYKPEDYILSYVVEPDSTPREPNDIHSSAGVFNENIGNDKTLNKCIDRIKNWISKLGLECTYADNENVKKDSEPKVSKLIIVNAGVRYWEDAEVNGEQDISYDDQVNGVKPKMPCVQAVEVERGIWSKKNVTEYRWCLEIDGDTGIILNWEKGTEAVAHYKVCDDCMIDYFVDSKFVCNNDDYYYVPDFLCLDDNGYGDYMDITIDKNGQIKNWNVDELLKWVETQKH